ncbi:MAG: DMT family transporter [Cellvibrionaceae bacterium]
MLLIGMGIPVMAALNGQLGIRLGSPLVATSALFLVGFFICFLAVLVSYSKNNNINYFDARGLPYYIGAFFVVFYILGITYISPKFGISNSIAFVFMGQMLSMALIDHYGFFGITEYRITFYRILGLVMMAVGVFFVVHKV